MNILVIGGAGFIGANVAKHHLQKGDNVTLLDNSFRDGVAHNLKELQKEGAEFVAADIVHNLDELNKAVVGMDVVYHLAAQTAVTVSVENPRLDFEVNAIGSFNVLEALRIHNPKAIAIYSSTNKVYGELEHVNIVEVNNRYQYENLSGVSEDHSLDFHSPYGCSKGTGDQYFRDYARIYGLKTIVFRQSCIYGPNQFAMEGQGWLAWFIQQAVKDKPLTIFGDGKQVRDVLFISDLMASFQAGIDNIDKAAGQVYNIGGGAENQLSLLELIKLIEEFNGKKMDVSHGDARPGDQKIYCSDVTKAKQHLNWEPKVGPREGVKQLYDWINTNSHLF